MCLADGPERDYVDSSWLYKERARYNSLLCPDPSQQLQQEFAEVTFALSDNKPCIIVVCCKPTDIPQALLFPTVIQTVDYSPSVLEATAALIFGEGPRTIAKTSSEPASDANRGLDYGQ